MTVEIKVSGNPAYLGLVTGSDAKFGTKIEFVKPARASSNRKQATFAVGPGLYKHQPREAEALNRRRDTGYLLIGEDGALTELSEDAAKAIAREMDVQAAAQQAACEGQVNHLAQYSDAQLLAEIRRRRL